MAQSSQAANVQTQRSAMDKLQFLVGTWSGHARIWQVPGSSIELIQTEPVIYKLDGLILTIEGIGKSKSDGRVALQAFGLISYDIDEYGEWTEVHEAAVGSEPGRKFMEIAVKRQNSRSGRAN